MHCTLVLDGVLLATGCNDGLINIYSIHDRGQTYKKYNMALRVRYCNTSNNV